MASKKFNNVYIKDNFEVVGPLEKDGLLKSYDLRLVLQGHQHIHEELLERDHWFVTAGAVCANWWNGPLVDTQEGYIVVHVDTENQITWEYIDYKWEAQKTDI